MEDTVDKMKITIVGNKSVGKSAILKALNSEYEKESGQNSKEIDNGLQDTIIMDGKKYLVEVHETNEENDSYIENLPLYYENIGCIIICYDVTNKDSYNQVTDFWMKEIKQHAPNNKIILVGTKIDLRNTVENALTPEDGESLKQKINAVKYVECSGKSKFGIQEIFEQAIHTLVNSAFKEIEEEKKPKQCLLQ